LAHHGIETNVGVGIEYAVQLIHRGQPLHWNNGTDAIAAAIAHPANLVSGILCLYKLAKRVALSSRNTTICQFNRPHRLTARHAIDFSHWPIPHHMQS
jgi:hypothetical protein